MKKIDLASSEAIQLVVQEMTKKRLFGLKVNKDSLQNMTIEEVVQKLGITEKYVIGLDVSLSIKEKPHYHIHWIDTRTFVAWQNIKKRALPRFGKENKIYEADEKADSDINAWYGYAVKENVIYISKDLDDTAIMVCAKRLAQIKKDEVSYHKKKNEKLEKKKTFEEKLFESLDKKLGYTNRDEVDFKHTLVMVSLVSMDELEQFLTINRVEYYAWKYLLQKHFISHSDYITAFSKFEYYKI